MKAKSSSQSLPLLLAGTSPDALQVAAAWGRGGGGGISWPASYGEATAVGGEARVSVNSVSFQLPDLRFLLQGDIPEDAVSREVQFKRDDGAHR